MKLSNGFWGLCFGIAIVLVGCKRELDQSPNAGTGAGGADAGRSRVDAGPDAAVTTPGLPDAGEGDATAAADGGPCTGSETRICSCGAMSGGSQTCVNGRWGVCRIPCSSSGLMGRCAEGTQACDEARSQWGACSILPAAADTCAPGNDDDCDGVPNRGCACSAGQTQTCDKGGLFGRCAEGTQTCSADGRWGPCSIAPAAQDTCATGNDDNCNGRTNEGCPCVDGQTRACKDGGLMGKCATGVQTCANSVWSTCSVVPSEADTCGPSNDDNCNGRLNEGCACVQGQTRSCASGGLFGKCAAGTQTCSAAGTWGSCSIVPATADRCVLGNDDNCNGKANEGCLCVMGQTRLCSEGGAKGACASGTQTCNAEGTWGACSVVAKTMDTCEPGDDSTCNGVPNEACVCKNGETQLCSKGGLQGKCAGGTQTCAAGKWGACSITPSAKDTCVSGNDDNCNGKTNEDCPCINGQTRLCSAGGLFGKCASGMQTCAGGAWGACSITPSASDTCEPDNDDNCNGTKNDNDKCICVRGMTQSCAASGAKGACAAGTQTCSAAGTWGACSIAPKPTDTCISVTNDDNCNGIPFEGCTCVNGTTMPCGACENTRTCTNGAWPACASCCPVAVSDGWSGYVITHQSTPWAIEWPPERDPNAARPVTETASGGMLVFPRDSVVRRVPGLSGGYVVSFSVTLDNDFAFHVDFADLTPGAVFPAFRRILDDAGRAGPIMLGGLRYGRSEAWTTFGSWSDQLTASGSTRTTLYVKAGTPAVAAVVGSIKSGFVTRPGALPGKFALVGSNLPRYDGSTQKARIGNITGCAGLSDSQVDARYRNDPTN